MAFAPVYVDFVRLNASLNAADLMFDPAFFDPDLFDLAGGVTDLADDMLQGFDTKIGIQSGNGPLDSIAGTGQLSYALRNDAFGTRPLGYYSPGNAAVRPGWTYGVPVQLIVVYGGVDYPRFTGKVNSILPDTGVNSALQVAVVAYDVMNDLANADLQEIAIQIGQSETQIVTNIIAALPVAAQPIATSFDPGADIFPYALDNLGQSMKALSVIADTLRSSLALCVAKSDGTLVIRSRHTRSNGVSSFTFSADFSDISIPSTLDGVYNLVRVTIHPKTIDAAATTVLYSLTGTVPVISAGETVTLWGSYNDPLNAQKLVGGTAMVTALVAYPSANYDYAGNAAIDGSGADLTSALSIVATAFATTVKFDVTNTGITPVYLVAPSTTVPMLRIRGKGVYDRGPQLYKASSVQPYGVRPIDIDMVYQNDPNVAQSAAEYVQGLYNTLTRQVDSLSFVANYSDAKMRFALTVEPGDTITVSEPVSGVTSVNVIVQSVALSMTDGILTCTLTLAPANAFLFWEWGVVGRSEWGTTTIYGF